MSHDTIPDNRNTTKAAQEWDSAIDFAPDSNAYGLVDALLSEADETDDILGKVYHAHQIETAQGKELDQFGKLVNVQRKSGESDAKYRVRIKAEFAQSRTGTTFNDFVEFAASTLGTDIQNIDVRTDYERLPAVVTVFASPQTYEENALASAELADILSGGVPAGHEVNAQGSGTLRLKSDGEQDEASKGLTSDSIETGGTLAADLVE